METMTELWSASVSAETHPPVQETDLLVSVLSCFLKKASKDEKDNHK